MKDLDKNLEQALANNGTLDPGRAGPIRGRALATFDNRMKRVERYVWIYLCISSWLIVGFLFLFLWSTSIQWLLFFGLLVLVFFEMTVLVKLWYWIMNSKISILKEMKEMRLEVLPAKDAAAQEKVTGDAQTPIGGLSSGERTVWKLVLIGVAAVAGAAGGVFLSRYVPTGGGEHHNMAFVTLEPDGRALEVTDTTCEWTWRRPARQFNFYAPKDAEVSWTDSRGCEMAYRSSAADEHEVYNVRLLEPVSPGERYSYRRRMELPKAARLEGDLWTYRSDIAYGYRANDFSAAVMLPRGAKIVSADPLPVASYTMDEHPVVRFAGTRGRNEPFRYEVQYRLSANLAPNAAGD